MSIVVLRGTLILAANSAVERPSFHFAPARWNTADEPVRDSPSTVPHMDSVPPSQGEEDIVARDITGIYNIYIPWHRLVIIWGDRFQLFLGKRSLKCPDTLVVINGGCLVSSLNTKESRHDLSIRVGCR